MGNRAVNKKKIAADNKDTSKARTKRSTTTAAREVKILHQIIETISYNLDLDEILKQIITLIDTVAHADEVFLYLLKDNVLMLRAAKKEVPAEYNDIRLKIGMGITGWVAKHKKTIQLSKKAYEDKRFYHFSNLKADKYEAFLSIPLTYHGKLIGVFNVQHKKEHIFTAREVRLMQIIAHATAGAIENARLFEQNVVLTQALETRKIIEKAKGKLMKQQGISESEAYQWIKKRSMDLRKSMKDVAEAILISLD